MEPSARTEVESRTWTGHGMPNHVCKWNEVYLNCVVFSGWNHLNLQLRDLLHRLREGESQYQLNMRWGVWCLMYDKEGKWISLRLPRFQGVSTLPRNNTSQQGVSSAWREIPPLIVSDGGGDSCSSRPIRRPGATAEMFTLLLPPRCEMVTHTGVQ